MCWYSPHVLICFIAAPSTVLSPRKMKLSQWHPTNITIGCLSFRQVHDDSGSCGIGERKMFTMWTSMQTWDGELMLSFFARSLRPAGLQDCGHRSRVTAMRDTQLSGHTTYLAFLDHAFQLSQSHGELQTGSSVPIRLIVCEGLPITCH